MARFSTLVDYLILSELPRLATIPSWKSGRIYSSGGCAKACPPFFIPMFRMGGTTPPSGGGAGATPPVGVWPSPTCTSRCNRLARWGVASQPIVGYISIILFYYSLWFYWQMVDTMYNEVMKRKQPKKRIWMPKCKAATFADRRTKRNRTRASQNRKAINISSK